MDIDLSEELSRKAYKQALRRAFWRNLRSRLLRRCNGLLPTSRVLDRLEASNVRHLGLQKVAIDSIVGSSGRHRDFDLEFLPLREENNDRWVRIARASYQGVRLPPPTLIRFGDAYFVEDGNHRVSVARARGQDYIEALVIEVDPSALIPERSCRRLGYKA